MENRAYTVLGFVAWEGVKDSLIKEFVRCSSGRAPDGRMMDTDYFHLTYDFGLKRVTSNAPAACWPTRRIRSSAFQTPIS